MFYAKSVHITLIYQLTYIYLTNSCVSILYPAIYLFSCFNAINGMYMYRMC
uniref:Uncharacterized protein n=1 Tax=Anguilla anguilla TaxID=7936 RepID=A0A0E9UQS1_ANGAN